ncbi:PssD/Cps14F family polysaccharide biosynthesis glycosyltransferase [Pseudoalteromonas nigrifaciens]|uniref:PssD/Cps14F family polysaccharide biosynthesis glycosyltransferase n=1 Tax=Pseudoalteromonas nigrifaciens TaxID=28109 RepID=UPI0018691358|nr:PssD/Cps14F family polysaccharide biosynthesis glycosyltransferase [Pseudoalteromonas nigrifaciens]
MTKTIVLTYGAGGHQEQMRRLVNLLASKLKEDIQYVVITDSAKPLNTQTEIVEYIQFRELRDKQSNLKTLLFLVPTVIKQSIRIVKMRKKYNLVGVISTGPGVSFLPTLILHILGIKTVGFESWSRFSEPSLSGRFFSKFVNLFYVQNKSMIKSYKSAIYRGRL